MVFGAHCIHALIVEIGLLIQRALELDELLRLFVIVRGALRMRYLRIPTKPAMHSNWKPATCSDLKPAGIPI